MKRTKIICTVGPSSLKKETLVKMYKAGMNAARINTAHGDFEQYEHVISLVRDVADIPLIFDIKGPEVRLHMEQDTLEVKKGDEFEVSDKQGTFWFSYPISEQLKIGDVVLFNDGNLETQLVKKHQHSIVVKCQNDFTLRKGVGVNIFNKSLNLPLLSDKDKKAIAYAKKNKIEFLALSFTRSAKDVKHLRHLLAGSAIQIIAKIETPEGVKNIDEIIRESDGVMVARGDLGIELPSEQVPLLQKEILLKCAKLGKLCIVATQMLKSMITSKRPTRAETSDVANAVLDGADCVMLSEETAIGNYPVETVQEMAKIAMAVEQHIRLVIDGRKSPDLSNSVAFAVSDMCKSLHIDKIVTLTASSHTTRMIARFRLKIPIVAITDNPVVKRQLELYFGVQPVLIPQRPKVDQILYCALHAYQLGVLRKTDMCVFAARLYSHKKRISNVVQVNQISELLEYEMMVKKK